MAKVHSATGSACPGGGEQKAGSPQAAQDLWVSGLRKARLSDVESADATLRSSLRYEAGVSIRFDLSYRTRVRCQSPLSISHSREGSHWSVNIRSARLILATPAGGMQLRVYAIAPGSGVNTLSVGI
jgi:hypothetical protein